MTLHPHVPSDDEPDSMFDLLDDCREVSGVLAPYVPSVVRLPEPRPAGDHTVDLTFDLTIDEAVAAGTAGWGDYGL